MKDFSGEFVKSSPEDVSGSPLKMCRLTSVDEGIFDGFLDIMDAEVAALTNNSSSTSSAMSSLFNAPVINRKSHISEDDDTPVVSIVRYIQTLKL